LFHEGGMTDAWTDTDRQTNLTVTFHNITNAPKNYCMLSKKFSRNLLMFHGASLWFILYTNT
jgi:hypothetical protein